MGAETVARPVPVPATRSSGSVAVAAGGLVILLAALWFLLGASAIYLAGCVVAGFGITYLSALPLKFEERVAFGAVLGAMAVAAASFVLSMIVQDVTLLTALAGLALALALGLGALAGNRRELAADWSDAAHRWSASPFSAANPWPLAAVVLVCGAWTVHFLHQVYVYNSDGLIAGYVNVWGDWAAHLTFAGSFAYGHNFPPQYPIDLGNRLGYPFMVDFFSADLVPLGSRLTASLTLTSGLLGLAFPAVLYLVAARFTGSRAAAAIAVFVFLLGGGLGFIYLIQDVDKSGVAALLHLPREYTLNRDLNYQWLDPVLAYLVPQRSTLFGFSLALIVLLLIWIAVRNEAGRRPLLFAGIVTGLLPVFHVHAYGTVVALAVFWAAFKRRRDWLAFFIPALALGLPMLAWMWPPANNSFCGSRPSVFGLCLQPGWLSYADWQRDGVAWMAPDFIWFWIKNLSVFLPLLIAAQFLRGWFPTDFGKWFAPMWLWFLVPSIVILQPWDWDNTKFFIFWALLGSIMVGGLLAALFRRGPEAAVLASALLVLLCLSGALDLARASDFSVSAVQFTDTGGIQLADWVRQNTSPDAVFVVADEHNNPIATLGGRRVLAGYPGWLWTYGLGDYAQKGADEQLILRGDPSTPALVQKYGISYVLIGPQELAPSRGANRAYWDAHGRLVYTNGEYALFKV